MAEENTDDLQFYEQVVRVLRGRRQQLQNNLHLEELILDNPGFNLDMAVLGSDVADLLELLFASKTKSKALTSVINNLSVANVKDANTLSEDVVQLIKNNTALTSDVLNLMNMDSIENTLLDLEKQCIKEMDHTKDAVANKRVETDPVMSEDDRLKTKLMRNLKKLNMTRILIQGLIAGHCDEPALLEILAQPRSDLTLQDFYKTWKTGLSASDQKK